MINVNIHEAKTNLSALVRAVEERGETVILQRHGKPVAEIHAYGSRGDAGGSTRDPFDRILVALAIREQLAVLTPDRTIPLYPVATIW